MVTSTKPDGTAITYTYDDKHRMVSHGGTPAPTAPYPASVEEEVTIG